MCKIVDWVMAVCMAAAGYQDWKTRQLPMWLLCLMSIVAAAARLFLIRELTWSAVGGVAVGLLFFGISKVTKEAVGYGDSWLVTILGMYLGGRRLLEVVLAATVLAGIFSLIFCVFRGWDRKRSIPFVPFLTVAYLGVVLL